MISYEAYVRGSNDNICTMVISLVDVDCAVCIQYAITGIPDFWRSSTILMKVFICLFPKRMFSRTLSQASRLSSRLVRSSTAKSALKRFSHDHAGTPQPPFVQRRAPNKSVGFGFPEIQCVAF